MKTLCEFVATKILPPLRAEIAQILSEKYKMKQTEVAKVLAVSQGSISLYATAMRAKDKNFLQQSPEIKKCTENIAKKLATGKLKHTPFTLCTVCKVIRKTDTFCKYHKKSLGLTQCRICYRGAKT